MDGTKKKPPTTTQALHPLDKLMRDIERTSKLETRLNRAGIDTIFLAIRRDIPYSTPIITATLASKLLADSSHLSTDLTLNTVVVNLSKALFNPNQKDELEQLVNNYFNARKKTEKQYSLKISEGLLSAYSLQEFPERARPALQQLTHALVEKLINEKQSRKIPGYKPESILEIINPILYHRIHPEIERVKTGQSLVFRQWLNTIAHEGYEKVSDETVLTIIHNEKEGAFKAFKKALSSKFPNAEALEEYLEILRYLQTDRKNHHDNLNILLNDFLKPDLGEIAKELHARCHERLRKLFNVADKNSAIYRSEETIENAHAQVFSEMEDELAIVKKIVVTMDTIKKNYSRNFLQALAGAKNLNQVKNAELDVMLGAALQRVDPSDQKVKVVREGGYPNRGIADVLMNLINYLETLNANMSGLFSDKLKQEVSFAINELRTVSSQLNVVKLVPADKLAASGATDDEHEVIPFPSAEEPRSKAEELKTAEPKMHKSVLADLPEAAPVAPAAEAVVKADEHVAVAAEPVQKAEPETFAQPAEEYQPAATAQPAEMTEPPVAAEPATFAPAELKIEDSAEEDFASFSLEPAKPLPLEIGELAFESELEDFQLESPVKPAAESAFEAAKPEEPLLDEFIPQERKAEELKVEEPKLEEAKIAEPKPLLNIEDFDDEIVLPETAAPATVTAAAAEAPASPLAAGQQIMKNYQLGEFEQPVQAAWEKMVSTSELATNTENSMLLPDDNEIRLYVICDLAQQIESVPAASMTDMNKEILQNIKELILLALKDPTNEDNWTFFEGPHRDQIDGAIASLRSGSAS